MAGERTAFVLEKGDCIFSDNIYSLRSPSEKELTMCFESRPDPSGCNDAMIPMIPMIAGPPDTSAPQRRACVAPRVYRRYRVCVCVCLCVCVWLHPT